MKPWLIALIVVVVIAVGVGGFFGGRATGNGGTVTPEQAIKTLQSMTPQQMQQALQSSGGIGGLFGGRGGPNGTGGTGANRAGGFVSGSIIAQDSNSITVKLADGSTKIVLYSASTTVNVAQQGSASDLAVGKDVTVTGTANADGSVTATRIQMGTLGGFNGRPPGTAADGAAPGAGGGASTSTTAGR